MENQKQSFNREWWSKARVGKEKDGRIKLSDEDKARIRELHKQGMGVREIARMYESQCSRRLIQFVIFPERLQTIRKHYKERGGWKVYYSKEARKLEMRKHRQKIREVHKTETL